MKNKLILLLLTALMITGCFKANKALVGSWQGESDDEVFTFFEDGSAVNSADDTAQWKITEEPPYKLTIVEDSRESTDTVEVGFIGKDTLHFYFMGDTITLLRQSDSLK